MAEPSTPDGSENEKPGNTWSYLIICCEDTGTGDTGPTEAAAPNPAGGMRALQGKDREFYHRPIQHQTRDAVHQPRTPSDAGKPTPSVNHVGSRSNRAPIAVVIPVRNRAGGRVWNALRSLQWQTAGRPVKTLIVSHGSQPDINERLSILCETEDAALLTIGSSAEPWNKPLALNTGLRATPVDVPFVMTMDVDMVLAPNLFAVVLDRLRRHPPALVLCRTSDLPAHASLPIGGDELKRTFEILRARSRLRPCYGCGGIQAAQRAFFVNIRGYDEDLVWWGAMDVDIVNRARLAGMQVEWIEDRTAMLHQWHPHKHSILSDRQEIELAKSAWWHNRALVRSRAKVLTRNPAGWGGNAD